MLRSMTPPPARKDSLTPKERLADQAYQAFVAETSRTRLLQLAYAFTIIFSVALAIDNLRLSPGSPEIAHINRWLPIQIATAVLCGVALRYLPLAKRRPVLVAGIFHGVCAGVGAYLLSGLGGFDGPFFCAIYLAPTFVTLLPCSLPERIYFTAALVLPFVIGFVGPHPEYLDYKFVHIPAVYLVTACVLNIGLGEISMRVLRDRFFMARELEEQNAKLEGEVHRQVEHAETLLGRVKSQHERVRAGLARSLHDDLGQLITGAKIELRALGRAMESRGDDASREEFSYLEGIVNELGHASRKLLTELREGGETADDDAPSRGSAE